MKLFRNREILRLAKLLALITAAGVAFALIISPSAAFIVAAVALASASAFALFTWWRYRELAKLSAYLARVSNGDYSLDLRDNVEGELSILKSEIYKVTVMLKEQAVALEQEKTALAEALSDISHQLKTPLTSMFVMTDLLYGDLPPDKRKEFTGRMRSQLERLQWLVTSLLKLSRLEAGTVKFSRRQADAGLLLQAASEPLLVPMELKGQKLERDVKCDAIYCDHKWTAEALVNIIKNCVEHTPRGGGIRLASRENPLYWEITVADTGSGIDKADLPYIFNRFYRGKNAAEDSLGIGLAMARSIVTAQGGSIDVRSGKTGTRFTLRFYK